MDPQDLDTGLLGIQLSSDSEGEGKGDSVPRNAQSEEAFREVKRTYRVKVEDGEIHTTIPLPLGPRVTKPTAQALLHAVEELYFFGRYAEGARFVRAVLGGGPSNPPDSASMVPLPPNGLDDDTRDTLRYYEGRCLEREREREREREEERDGGREGENGMGRMG
ncbi:hypothetical protein F4775DRAFT_316081 [Biscogniauxia sp. FL1348]|nr:hypothetical protein F4775DRAFT_316081 [Biscogniauxia sp. FL1348]